MQMADGTQTFHKHCISPLLTSLLVLALMGLVGPTAASKAGVPKLPASRIVKDLSVKGVIKVQPRPKGAGATHYLKEGKTMWEQTVWITRKTEFPGVTKLVVGDVEYHWEGGRWVYKRFRKAGHEYKGLKNPSPKEFKALLGIVGQEAVMDTLSQKYATKIYSVKLAKDPKWLWSDPKTVHFRATVVYDKITGLDLSKVSQDFNVTLKRASYKGGFTAYCKKDPTCMFGRKPEQQKVLKKTRVGADGLKKMQTIYEIAREKWVAPKYAALGAPKEWTDLRQFANYVYKALYSGDLKTWQAFLIRNQDDWTHHDKGRDIFIDSAEAFRSQFCPELVATKVTGRKGDVMYVKFSDKAGKADCMISVRNFNGYRIDGLRCGFATGEEAEKIAAIPVEKGCVENLPEAQVYNKLGLKVGEKVMSKWHGNGKEYPGKVSELKDKTVWIKYDDGSSEEVPYDGVRRMGDAPAKADAKASKPAPAAKPAADGDANPLGLKPGDPIMSKWHGNGREYPGKVGKLKGGKVWVEYDDGSKEWVPMKAVRRK